MTTAEFHRRILDAFPLDAWRQRRVAVAASGGPDSVALALAITRIAEENLLKDNLLIITIDHGLRGDESAEDAAFVGRLADRLGVRFLIKKLDPDEFEEAKKKYSSVENAARELRYAALVEAAGRFGARFLLTAHHRDDQLETILFRLFRGTGPDGLQGVAPVRALDESLALVRPMLQIARNDVLKYLDETGQDYRVDSSNAESIYARNRIRNELIPLLDEIFPNRWTGALTRFATLNAELVEHVEESVDTLEDQIRLAKAKEERARATLREMNALPRERFEATDAETVVVPSAPLRDYSPVVLRRYFRRLWRRNDWPLGDMGSAEWTRLADAVVQRKTTALFPGNIQLTFPNDDSIMLERRGND